MLVLNIQMWPRGDKTKAYTVGVMTVALTGIEKGRRSYRWSISKFRGKSLWKTGTINGHNPRNRGPWDLLFRILRQAVGQRNPE